MTRIPVQDVNHSFGVAVSIVGIMGWPIVYHRFVDGVLGFIRKNTRRQARDNLHDIRFVAHQKDVVVHHHVVPLVIWDDMEY